MKLGTSQLNVATSSKRYERSQARKESKVRIEAAEALVHLQVSSQNNNSEDIPLSEDSTTLRPVSSFSLQGTLRNDTKEPEKGEDKEIKSLNDEILFLKEKLSAGTGDISPDTFRDPEKVKYYNRLPHVTLMVLFTFLEPHITYTAKTLLPNFKS